MSRVLIVSKTRMRGDHVCVGGHDLDKKMRSVRLLRPDGTNMPVDVRFEIGQVWELDYEPAPNVRPPHIEDVLVDPSGARHVDATSRDRSRGWRDIHDDRSSDGEATTVSAYPRTS